MFAFSSVIPTSLNILIISLSVLLCYILYSLIFLTFFGGACPGEGSTPPSDSRQEWECLEMKQETAAAVEAGRL